MQLTWGANTPEMEPNCNSVFLLPSSFFFFPYLPLNVCWLEDTLPSLEENAGWSHALSALR